MSNIADIIRRKAQEYGVDPTTALSFAQIESSLNPSPRTGNGGGLYQFNGDWWKKYGNGKTITDAEANADAFMRYYNQDLVPEMNKALGRNATPAELYMGHQQGLAGGPALLADPNAKAADALASAYGGGVSGLKQATAALKANGGDPNAPAGDFFKLWSDRFSAAGRSFDPNFSVGSAQISTPKPPAMAQTPDAPAPEINPHEQQHAPAAQTPQTPKLDQAALMAQQNFSALGQAGANMLAQASPQTQAPPLQASPVYRPQAQSLFANPFISQEELTRRMPRGLFG